MKKRIAFVVNVDSFFISHRLPLALKALEENYEVFLLTKDTGLRKTIESYGINFVNIPFERSGKNPFHELFCVYQLVKSYLKIKPSIIHHITLKSILLGCVAAKITNKKNVVNAISGFGYNFTDGRKGLTPQIIELLIRFFLKKDTYSFILQNPDDFETICSMNLTTPDKVYLIKGSGIDLNEYKYAKPVSKHKIKVLFPARILKDKGIVELLTSAKDLKKDLEEKVKFVIVGHCDIDNLASMKEEELKLYLEEDYIEWKGYQSSMYDYYVESDIVVLPSYREGLPKSLIEAAAVGRPIVTTDAPGCRECVIDNFNGFLVPVRNVDRLSDSIKKLVLDSDLRIDYGVNSRKLAEREFSLKSVIEKTFNIYDSYLK